MSSLVDILNQFVGVPASPVESVVLYTGAIIFSFVLLTYGLRLLSVLVRTSSLR